AMNDAFGMSGVEGIGDLDGPVFENNYAHGLAAEAMVKRLTFEQLHSNEPLAILLADIEEGANIGMIERRGGASFALKTLERLGIAGHLFRQKLERDMAAKAGVFSLVDHAHAAGAEL